MSNISLKLKLLKDKLESAAFLVGKGGSEEQAHSKIIQSLIIVSEIDAAYSLPVAAEPSTDAESHELRKVRRRLKLWSRKPHQINSRILNAYLKLKRSGVDIVTEQMLRNELPSEKSFNSNFAQMKIIAEKNHGKIFEQHGDQIGLWPPIVNDVAEYEKVVIYGIQIEEGSREMAIREQAKAWLRNHFPADSSNQLRVSKYHREQDIWFFTFPYDYFDENKTGCLSILLQDKDDLSNFRFLKVPFSFFRKNKNKFDLRSGGDKFDLHISAKKRNWLECERSNQVSFREFNQQ